MSWRVGAALLAAGASRRLGLPKQLVRWEGVSLVRRLATELCASQLTAAAVVVGCEAPRVSREVADLPLALLNNDAWREGVASSIRRAVDWAQDEGLDALLLASCDQLRLERTHVTALVAALAAGRAQGVEAVASQYDAVSGVPAVFTRARFADLRALEGDRGAAKLLRGDASRPRDIRDMPWPAGSDDVDTEDDMRRLGLEWPAPEPA
ncbi:MAG: NTP transferase domain-containing protein [Polyangiales bacterium]